MRVLQAKTKRPLDLLAIGAGGRVAAACSLFGVPGDVDVWEGASEKPVHTHPGERREVRSLGFHPDGRHLFVGEQDAVRVVDAVTKAAVADREAQLGFPEFALSRDGSRLLITSSMNQAGAVECWAVTPEVTVRQALWSEGPDEFLWFGNPALGPDGLRAAVSVRLGVGGVARNVVALRDAATGMRQSEIEFGAADPLLQLAFSADGSRLLARSSGRTVKVFDAATGQPAGELVHPGRPYVTGMAVHPNGQVACSRNNGTICFWNPDCTLGRVLDWKLGKLVSVAFAPDGSIGAAGTEDGQVVVWDVDA